MTIPELIEQFIEQLEREGNEFQLCLDAYKTHKIGENIEHRYQFMQDLKKGFQFSFKSYIQTLELIKDVPSSVWVEVCRNMMYAQTLYDEVEAMLQVHKDTKAKNEAK